MQLVAYGAQDIYLTGNPQITFFKVVYRRHTNFSMEAIEQTINGSSTCASGGGATGTVTISRNGDLVYKVYVTSSTSGITRGDLIVNEVELEIGGQMIDRHYAEWNQVWNELTTPASKALGLKAMTSSFHGDIAGGGIGPGLVQVPLNFWFCRNPGLALPLIALQYHEVKLKFTWGDGGSNAFDTDTLIHTPKVGAIASCKVFCDYIYLDTDERRRFAQVSHEYLIEQLQKQSGSGEKNTKLIFNHPVKELIWTTPVINDYTTAKLVLNGHDRFSEQEEEYFQLRQPYDYHTVVPMVNLPESHHPAFSATEQQLLVGLGAATAFVTHAANVGLASEPCTKSSLTFVNLTGFTAGSLTTPAAGIAITAATGVASPIHGFIIGALAAKCAFPVNSLRVGDHLMIVRTPGAGGGGEVLRTRITQIILSDIGTAETIAKTSGALGPLHYGNSGADENHLTAGGAADDITDGTGGGVLVLLDSFTLTLQGHNQEIAIDGGGIWTTAINTTATDQFTVMNLSPHGAVEAGVDPHEAATSLFTRRINVYSFALKPEEHQPSGTCNFSRIDNAQLQTTGTTALASTDNIYAVNYNVLRIMSGMGGLAYSN